MPKHSNHEDFLRDYISLHLSKLEIGLRLVDTEYYLPNSEGTRGFIDILAIDKYNNYVVIEIKRRDAAAREALHEVHKYVRLLKQNYGARDGEFRIIIVSTEWKELLSAFSEFKASSPYMCEGFLAQPDKDDFELIRLEVSEKYNTKKLSPHHTAILFESHEERSLSVASIVRYLNSINFRDYIIVLAEINYDIPFPFMAYLCLRRFPEEHYIKEIGIDTEQSGVEDFDNLIDAYETEVIIECLNRKIGYTEVNAGYPERFHTLLLEGWSIESIIKGGVYDSDPRSTDQVLISEISSYEADNKVIFKAHFSSENRAKLYTIKYALLDFLSGIPMWQKFAEDTFNIIERTREAEIKIYSFNPMCILTNLQQIKLDGKVDDWTPNMSIAINSKNLQRVYAGALEWNGRTPRYSLIKDNVVKDAFEFLLQHSLSGSADFELRLCSMMGLSYGNKMFDANRLSYNLNQSYLSYIYGGISKFFAKNTSFIDDLANDFSAVSVQTSYQDFPER